MLEKDFARQVDRDLRHLQNSWFFNCNQLSIRGLPDRIGCVQGVFIGLEIKRSDSESRRATGRICLQRHRMNQISGAGGFSMIVHPDNWKGIFETLLKLSLSEDPHDVF